MFINLPDDIFRYIISFISSHIDILNYITLNKNIYDVVIKNNRKYNCNIDYYIFATSKYIFNKILYNHDSNYYNRKYIQSINLIIYNNNNPTYFTFFMEMIKNVKFFHVKIIKIYIPKHKRKYYLDYVPFVNWVKIHEKNNIKVIIKLVTWDNLVKFKKLRTELLKYKIKNEKSKKRKISKYINKIIKIFK